MPRRIAVLAIFFWSASCHRELPFVADRLPDTAFFEDIPMDSAVDLAQRSDNSDSVVTSTEPREGPSAEDPIPSEPEWDDLVSDPLPMPSDRDAINRDETVPVEPDIQDVSEDSPSPEEVLVLPDHPIPPESGDNHEDVTIEEVSEEVGDSPTLDHHPDVVVDFGPPPEPFSCWADSFEWETNPGWETTGLWHRVHASQDLWDIWASPPYEYVLLSGPNTLSKPKHGVFAFWYGRDGDGSYLGDPAEVQVAGGGTSIEPHEGVLVSPWLDLSGMAHATLFFWSWWEIESQHPVEYDLSTVEVSRDGESWHEVGRLNPRKVPVGAKPVLPYTVNGVGMPPSWQRTVVNLDAFVGGPVRFRFRFRTGDVFYNAFRGWMVDEVSIECVPGGRSSNAP